MVNVTKTNYDTAMLVGARPNFVKVAPLLSKFEENNLNVLFIHTGQHWDKNMSEDIFRDIGLREPDINLNVQKKSMNQQLGSMIQELDKYLQISNVNNLFVFGDVTSTLAGAIAAKNNSLNCFHVEAGLRSKNLNAPEERNRVMVDAICDKLFTPSKDAVENLINENIHSEKINNVGNIMIDTLVKNLQKITANDNFSPDEFSIDREYFVLTLHRPINLTDQNLEIIFSGISEFNQESINKDLVFSTSTASEHSSNANIQNLSSLFLKEFYKKLKSTFTPGLENIAFADEIDAGNFIKRAKDFYASKGTNEAIKILFKIIFAESPSIINLEDYLIKPSSANYIRREVVVAEVVSGEPLKIVGETLVKTTDESTTASISSVEPFTRKGKTFYIIEF